MSAKTIEFNEVCKSCEGTGLYVGLAERNKSAVVCHTCKGTGCYHFKHEYEEFEAKAVKCNVERVFEVNPGICIGTGKDYKYKLEDFGGMPFVHWSIGKPFPPKSENRKFTCPAWWYQCADYKQKPDWPECKGCGSFAGCDRFLSKHCCWLKFDKEKAKCE